MKESIEDTQKWKDLPCALIGRFIIIIIIILVLGPCTFYTSAPPLPIPMEEPVLLKCPCFLK
jgi:hypothetical protein